MFADALRVVDNYTMPVIFSGRHMNGSISSGCGTFIVINKDGWILTAAHIVKQLVLWEQDIANVVEYEQNKNEILNNNQLHPKDKHKRVQKLTVDKKWVTNTAVLWAFPGASIKRYHVNEFPDLATGKLEPFNPDWVKNYPVFKNPAEPMLPGTSLCRLGFPFHRIDCAFNDTTKEFKLADGVLPVPRFPNDGIHTRISMFVTPDKKQQAKFLETSTPGLMGQSGGPIFDRNGHVWAIQSKTYSLPLGFTPEAVEGNRKVVEHQFMNVGLGSHVEEIIAFLTKNSVSFELSSQ